MSQVIRHEERRKLVEEAATGYTVSQLPYPDRVYERLVDNRGLASECKPNEVEQNGDVV